MLVNGVSISGSGGGGGGSTDISALNAFTGSANTSLSALDTFTGSANTSITALNSATGSFATTASVNLQDLTITNLSGSLIPGDGSTSSIAVTVDGNQKFVLDGTVTASINLTAGNAYKFDTSDNSNLNHPFAFKLASDSSTTYTTGVTVNGSGYNSPAPGESGAYVQISVTNATPNLIYYCTSHGNGMGGGAILTIITGSQIQNGFLEVSGSTRLSGSLDVLTDITASGNISSSGTITMLTASTGGGIFTSASLAAGGGGGSAFPFSGDAQITGSLTVSSSNSTASLSLRGSGSTLFEVIGSEGTIFSLDDELDGTLFTVNDRSGIPQLLVSSSGRIEAEEGEAVIRSQRPIVTVGTNPFTASLDNAGQYFRVGGNVTCSIFVSASVSCPIGAEFDFFQTSSAGNMLFETGSGVTLNSKNGNLNLAGQFSSATLKYVNNDEWDLMGDLT